VEVSRKRRMTSGVRDGTIGQGGMRERGALKEEEPSPLEDSDNVFECGREEVKGLG